MTAQAQLSATGQSMSIAGWTEMFPNKVDTFVGSKKFIKKLTALVFSSITYMRGIFPENAYMINELGGRQLKVLTGSYTNHNAYLMIRWLKSAFEALDRNYMRQLIFEILDQKNTPIEYYSVDFSYKGDEVTCSLASGTQTEKNKLHVDQIKLQHQTTNLIHTLLAITEDLKPLPKLHYLRLKVTYHEGTPDDYIPKYFSNQNDVDLESLPQFKRNDLGNVKTPFHSLSVRNGSMFAHDDTENDVFPNEALLEKPGKNTQPLSTTTTTTTNVMNPSKDNCQEIKNNVSSRKRQINGVTKSLSQESLTQTGLDNTADFEWNENKRKKNAININCICESTSKQCDIFQCAHCGSWQHYVCYRRKPGAKEPENACCLACAKLNPDLECTEKSLMDFSLRKAKALAIYRQMLYHCWDNKMFSLSSFSKYFKTTPKMFEDIIQKMIEEKFISRKKKSSSMFQVNTSHVNKILNEYFKDS